MGVMGSIDTQRDFCFASIFRPKPLQFFFLWGNISFQLDKGMWRLQIIAGLWVATNCLAWQIFIGRFTGGFLLAEVVSRLFRERSGTIGDVRDGPPFKQTLKTMMQQNRVFFLDHLVGADDLETHSWPAQHTFFFWKGYMADWRMLKKSQLDELIVAWCYGGPMAISIFIIYIYTYITPKLREVPGSDPSWRAFFFQSGWNTTLIDRFLGLCKGSHLSKSPTFQLLKIEEATGPLEWKDVKLR